MLYVRNLKSEWYVSELFYFIIFKAWFHHPAVLFNPVVENCNSDHNGFLCNHPIYDFKQVSFVPAIFGVNSGEGGMFVSCKLLQSLHIRV
jgi:hypothetical protein